MASKAMVLANSALERAGATVKAMLPFNSWGGNNYMSGGYGGGLFGNRGILGASPGTGYDYRGAAGNLHQNGVVAACTGAIARALSDAPLCVERKTALDSGNDRWEKVQSTAEGISPKDMVACKRILSLLENPNDKYSSHALWYPTVMMECTAGNAFWLMEVDRAGAPTKLWYEPVMGVEYDKANFVTRYWVPRDGKWFPWPVNQTVHFRYTLDPANPRHGWTPVSTVLRQIAGDNGVATYHGGLLRNSAVPSLFASAKDMSAATSISQQGFTNSQFETWMRQVWEKLSGDGAGGMAGTTMPMDLQVLGFSPEQLALDKLSDYHERRICSVLDVPPMVIGLGAGADHMTYSNLGEAQSQFWQWCVLPRGRQHVAELQIQFVPLFGLDPQEYRIAHDYTNVAALQEDQDKLYTRLENAAGGPFLTPNEARERVKLAAVEDGDKLREKAAPPEPGANNAVNADNTRLAAQKFLATHGAAVSVSEADIYEFADGIKASPSEIAELLREHAGGTIRHHFDLREVFVEMCKARNIAARNIAAKFDDSEPRDEGGKWTAGGGGSGKGSSPATRTPPPHLSDKAQRAKDAHHMVDKSVQRYAEDHNEPRFARAIKGISFPDSEPVDVVVGKGGLVAHGVELKTIVDNKAEKLTMDRYAQVRKINWERDNNAAYHTVVIDDQKVYNANGPGQHDESQRVYYYRRGVAGSARISAMHKTKDLKEVQALMKMPEADLPPAARRTDAKNRDGTWKFFTDAQGKGYKNSKTGDVVRPKK